MVKFILLIFLSLTYGSISTSSSDPMFDPYIDMITRLDLNELMSIPEKSDEQFLYDLLHGDDSIKGVSLRLNIPTESDVKRTDQAVAQAEMDEDWEKLMVAGPIAVNYLGNLMVLASTEDFAFQAPLNYQFRYIRFPTSFKATLAQVASEMHLALFGAHTAMDRIQSGVRQIPGHVKTALKLLTSGSPLMIKKMLPLSINHIGRLANESVLQANKTVDQFTNLLHLLDEISQLSIATGSANKDLLKNNEKQMNESITKQQKLNEHLSDIQKQYKAAQQELEEARAAYKAAFAAIPSGGGVVGPKPRIFNKIPSSFIAHTSINVPNTLSMQPSSRSVIAAIGAAVAVVDSIVTVLGNIFGLGEKEKEPVVIDNTAHTNAMDKANLALQRLREAEEAHKIQFEQHLLEQNNLAAIMREMTQLNLTKLNTEEIGAILINATKQIIDIRVQWSKLVHFFSKVSVQADTTQKIIVAEFIEVIEVTQLDNEPLSDADRAFFLELIIPTVSLIDRESSLLYSMAVTYYKVSGEYMLDQIAGVTALIVTETVEERHKQLELASNLTTTNSQKVAALATQMRAQFVKDIDELENMYTTYVAELAAIELSSLVG
ncbi:unnamed protein product [Adineta steineri]|uniref:Uncharacterized protein n=1 Tax=Adineta steineri TaxID=433720 RepID=A0A818JHR9_9BILA|nr:unnamed protein product [Adineta steineri]CAF1060719.1 unnamed protein product [Adineta steineri]CAF3544371.1 unnamed protein product [Adineta steineri]CAF3834400.1 unnamed protein product [Adineta steineri]